MARDILSEYGKDLPNRDKPRATNGGHMEVKPINYSPPVGPSNVNSPQTPGNHGDNHGNCGTQGRH